VLGAGAARGWAHIGALRELDTLGVHLDVVVGSSIGTLVGGCYAAGRLDMLETFARSLTRRRVLGLLDFSFTGSGLIGGQRLRARLEAGLGGLRIEDLPVQFAAVATEIGGGHEIWLRRGLLVDAIRASYALPGVFEPVKVDGRWLFARRTVAVDWKQMGPSSWTKDLPDDTGCLFGEHDARDPSYLVLEHPLFARHR